MQKGGSVVKNTDRSCKGIKFNSQHPYWGFHLHGLLCILSPQLTVLPCTHTRTHTQNSTHTKSQKSFNEWVEIVKGQGDVWLFPKWNDLKMLKWIWEILRHRANIVDKILTQAKSRKFRNTLWNDWNKRFLVKNLKNSLVLNVTALQLMMVFIHSIAIY